MTIRAATAADLPPILAIYNHAILHTTAVYSDQPTALDERQQWLAARSAANLPVLVAECGGAVAGFGSYGPFRTWPGYRYTVEHSVYVDAAWRGQGLGRGLLRALIAAARAQGMHALIAGIDAGNHPSIQLHRSLGFAQVGALREVGRKFDRWLDLGLFELILE